MIPKGNGLVELHDSKQKEHGFFCMQLVMYLNTEAEMGTERYRELWDERFTAMKLGACAYRYRCPIYARTIKNHPVQQDLFASQNTIPERRNENVTGKRT